MEMKLLSLGAFSLLRRGCTQVMIVTMSAPERLRAATAAGFPGGGF